MFDWLVNVFPPSAERYSVCASVKISTVFWSLPNHWMSSSSPSITCRVTATSDANEEGSATARNTSAEATAVHVGVIVAGNEEVL